MEYEGQDVVEQGVAHVQHRKDQHGKRHQVQREKELIAVAPHGLGGRQDHQRHGDA
jgi:hypothetical protein